MIYFYWFTFSSSVWATGWRRKPHQSWHDNHAFIAHLADNINDRPDDHVAPLQRELAQNLPPFTAAPAGMLRRVELLPSACHSVRQWGANKGLNGRMQEASNHVWPLWMWRNNCPQPLISSQEIWFICVSRRFRGPTNPQPSAGTTPKV